MGGHGHGRSDSGRGRGNGNKRPYDWTKHLPRNHPMRRTAGMSRDEREAMHADPEFQRQRNEYREERRHMKNEQDSVFLQSCGFTEEEIQAAASTGDVEGESSSRTEQRQQRLKSLARDLNPQKLTFPPQNFTLELSHACAALELLRSRSDTHGHSDSSGGDGVTTAAPLSELASQSQYKPSSPSSGKSNEMLQEELKENQKSKQYIAMQKQRKRLPAFQRQDEIVKTIQNNQVTVISGSTGCGKTTQVPQFVLDSEIAAGRGASCNIICTQPRRISAIGVAERVAAEKSERLGKTVGYQIRLERRASDDTKLLFCTTGILLRRLAGDPLLSGVSHVFLDEVHERNSNSDFSLIILRDLLKIRSDLRVVLMSATLNADSFASYFSVTGTNSNSVPQTVPTLHIPGFTFPVESFFLEDALKMTRHNLNKLGQHKGRRGRGRHGGRNRSLTTYTPEEKDEISQSLLSKGYDQQVVDGVLGFDESEIDVELIASLCVQLHNEEKNLGAVLIFVPGWSEIQKVHEALRPLSHDRMWKLFPLHGSLPTSQQREIFKPPPSGMRKIVISTNIAESSITIDDVVYVIDTCRHKAKTYDAERNVACLLPAWVSRASAIQRRGRAGRVQAGKCWHLVPQFRMKSFQEYELPEMLRTPLEQLCLQTRSLKLANKGPGGIKNFMQKAMDKPEHLALDNAMSKLLRIGALNRHDESLTPLGHVLALLPMEPAIGKALVLAAIFGCLEPMLTITAVLSHRTPFVMPLENQLEADRAKLRFSQQTNSDHRAFIEAYESWLEEERRGNGFNFARRNYLSGSVLRMVRDIREQFRQLLVPTGLVASVGPVSEERSLGLRQTSLEHLSKKEEWELVKAVLMAGVYPNLCRVDEGRHRHKTKFFTRENGKVDLHPASVNTKHNSWSTQRWITYFDKQRTQGGLFVYDTTVVSSMSIMVFGAGDVDNSNGAFFELASDGWPTRLSEEELKLLNGPMKVAQSEDGEDEGVFFHEDPTIQFVATLLHRNGGSYGMSRLSGLLKRQFPSHRQRIGSIRKWVERSEVMHMTKQGSWIVSLVPGAGSQGKSSESKPTGPRKTSFYGVEDWVYFYCDRTQEMDVLQRAREQLRMVLSRKLNGDSTFLAKDTQFLNALRNFIVAASDSEAQLNNVHPHKYSNSRTQ